MTDKEQGSERDWAADPPRVWKFSWRWLSKQLNCTTEGITGPNGCGGCCVSADYWPPSAGGEDYGYMCPMLGDNGCSYSVQDRPIVCLMYPLTVSEHGNVGMLLQSTRPNANTAPCYRAGPKIIDVLKEQLTEVIGAENYALVKAGVDTERDVEITVPYLVILQLAKEYVWATHGVVPKARTGGPQPPVTRTKPVLLPWRHRRDLARGSGTFYPHPNLLDVHIRHRSVPDEEPTQPPLI